MNYFLLNNLKKSIIEKNITRGSSITVIKLVIFLLNASPTDFEIIFHSVSFFIVSLCCLEDDFLSSFCYCNFLSNVFRKRKNVI